jgi:predicted Zn-dependent protease
MPPSRRKPAAETIDANRYVRAANERLTIDPRDVDALFTAAAFLARRGKLEAAARTLDRIAEVNTDYPGLWRFLARLYEDMEEERLADLCLARASMTG